VTEEQRFDMVRHACPGAGACGGMYTANTMASSIEALGMSLPYSSSIPATDPLKLDECRMAGRWVRLICYFLDQMIMIFLIPKFQLVTNLQFYLLCF
jgi:dihydroxyacid dehydratase/phosphogluconate dehydratase